MVLRISPIVLVIFAALGCAAVQTREPLILREPALTGGTSVSESDSIASSVVLLLTVSDAYNQIKSCTGTVVSSKFILTAAHCVSSNGAKDDTNVVFVIFHPTFDLSDNKMAEIAFSPEKRDIQQVGRDRIYRYPFFKNNREGRAIRHDIALLRLSLPPPENYKPIPLSRDSGVVTAGAQVMLAGYGPPSKGDHKLETQQLRKLNSTIAKGSEYSVFHVLNHIQEPLRGPSVGDSGGPATMRVDGIETQVGVYSWGQAYNDNLTSAYWSVGDYYDWIDSVMKIHGD